MGLSCSSRKATVASSAFGVARTVSVLVASRWRGSTRQSGREGRRVVEAEWGAPRRDLESHEGRVGGVVRRRAVRDGEAAEGGEQVVRRVGERVVPRHGLVVVEGHRLALVDGRDDVADVELGRGSAYPGDGPELAGNPAHAHGERLLDWLGGTRRLR